ncbi:MAG: phospholipase D-like domain-containing protein [Ktedonobacterales bacterium]
MWLRRWFAYLRQRLVALWPGAETGKVALMAQAGQASLAVSQTGQAQTEGQVEQTWWAQGGDFPPREGCVVEPLVDGQVAMLAMCRAFLGAKHYILLAGWDLRADLLLVRGEDAHVGDDDSAEQRELLESLRREGLSDDAIALWNENKLRVCDVLGFAAQHGVQVGVLLWDAFHAGSHLTNNPAHEAEQLRAVGVDCLLDDSSRSVTHIMQSLHQKVCVVDGRVAFVGGVDLTFQANGDYDRWDTHHHPCASQVRGTEHSVARHPWHDAHTRVTGPAVADVFTNIVQRWSDVAKRHKVSDWPAQLATPQSQPLPNGHTAQVVRTIPPNTYQFAPLGIGAILDAYLHAIRRAQCYIYIENQYLWEHIFVGLDVTQWGERSAEMSLLFETLEGALERGVALTFLLPDHPNCGRRFTDQGIDWLRERAPQAAQEGRLNVFALGVSDDQDFAPGGVRFRPVYVHAKVAIVDDTWWIAGSANLNSRGMHSDAEIDVATLDPATARDLRIALWSEHLHPTTEEIVRFNDPVDALTLLRASAEANRAHIERREHLEGHLLPYITHAEAVRFKLPVHPEHGWLDNLKGGAGPSKPEYAGRYL